MCVSAASFANDRATDMEVSELQALLMVWWQFLTLVESSAVCVVRIKVLVLGIAGIDYRNVIGIPEGNGVEAGEDLV